MAPALPARGDLRLGPILRDPAVVPRERRRKGRDRQDGVNGVASTGQLNNGAIVDVPIAVAAACERWIGLSLPDRS